VPGAGPAAAHRTRGVPRAVPPAGIPLTFLAAAGAGLVAFGAAIAAVAPTAVTAPNAPEPIGAVHLGMLAFLSTAVLGAMHQFAPVASERPLRSPRVAYATAVVWIPTVWVLASGFASGHPAVVSAGGVAASVAIALAAWNLSAPLSARGKGTPVAGLRIALTFLVITAGFGVTYAFDRHTGWFALFPRRVLAHAHLGLLGWLGVAYVAVAEKLWPMFLLAHRPGARSGAWAIRLLPAGALVLAAGVLLPSPPLAVAGGVLVAGGLAAHLTSLAGLLRHRRRSLELLHAFILSSAASLVVAAVAGTVAGLAPVSTTWRVRLTSVEVLALAGWLALAVIGHAHKIVPFIAWTRLREKGFKTNRDGAPLLFAHLYDRRVARATYLAAVAGLGVALAGLASATAAALRAGGILLAIAGGLAVVNLATGPHRATGPHPTEEVSPCP